MNDKHLYRGQVHEKTHLDEPMTYALRIEGHLGPQWKNWFGGAEISLEKDGNSLITVPVVDQSALHGVLRKIRNAGMSLESVVRVRSTYNKKES
ncbi:MAG: hypothetical protein ACC707_10990 [Thiohalomonadales bacterium]